jgi:hypothetical protein
MARSEQRVSLVWLQCFAIAFLAAPVITILHELGHYAVGAAWDFPGQVLHATSVPDTAADAGVPEWQRGVKNVAGPLVNWLFVGVACLLASRLRDTRWPAVVGLVATVRPGLIAVVFLASRVLGATGQADFDEANAARAFDLPLIPIVLVVLAITAAAWWFLLSRMPRRGRLGAIAGVLIGAVVGYVVYERIANALLT